MKKKLIAILVAYGMAQAAAEAAIDKLDAAGDDIDLDALKAAHAEKQKELLKNDASFVGDIQKAEAAKRRDMWITKIKKRSGITAEEIKDKTDDEIADMAFEKIRKKGDATNEQLQAENVSLQAEVKKLREEELPAAQNRSKEVERALKTDNEFEKLIGGLDKKLRVGAIAAIAAAKAKMGDNFKIELDDNNKIVIKTKDGLLPKSSDGTKILTAKEFITNVLDEEKLLENSAPTPEPNKNPGVTVTAEEKKAELHARFPHLKAAEDHQAKVKADLEARKTA